jgi:hypothetical protein
MEIRSLTAEEVRVRGRPKGAVGKIREVHHFVARMYAKGHKPPEIAKVVNRTSATVRNWLATPANAELVAQYAADYGELAEGELDYRLQLRRQASTMALEKLVEKLQAEEIEEPKMLLAIASDSDDRTGLGRTETKFNLNVDLGTRLDKARERRDRILEARIEGNVVKLERRF